VVQVDDEPVDGRRFLLDFNAKTGSEERKGFRKTDARLPNRAESFSVVRIDVAPALRAAANTRSRSAEV